jgi:hypothetical protein
VPHRRAGCGTTRTGAGSEVGGAPEGVAGTDPDAGASARTWVQGAAGAHRTRRTTVTGTDIHDTDIVCKGIVIGSLTGSLTVAARS